MASIVPSFLAPIRTCIFISCLELLAAKVSSRVYTILLGFLSFHVTNAVKISQQAVCLAPKPPPILGLMTLIFDFGISKALLKIRRTWKGICVELTQFKRPYVSI